MCVYLEGVGVGGTSKGIQTATNKSNCAFNGCSSRIEACGEENHQKQNKTKLSAKLTI